MAAERHVGTPECLNETCACGSAPKPEEWGPALKERRERIATAFGPAALAALAYKRTPGAFEEDVARVARLSLACADALIVELDK